VLPEAAFIQQTLNEQLFMKAGYRFEFRPEELSGFQEEEARRAEAFGHLAQRLPASLALRLLGFDLPGDVDWDEIDRLSDDVRDNEAERAKQARKTTKKLPADELKKLDLDRWKRKVLKSVRANRGVEVEFESEWIEADVMAAVRKDLRAADSLDAVKRVFEGVLA